MTFATTGSLYHAGLQQRDEAVISAHFMHAQNLNPDLKFYTREEFNRQSIPLSTERFVKEILPAIRGQVDDVIRIRVAQNLATARKNFRDYGIADANKIGVAEIIAEALVDPWYRKGPLANINKTYIRDSVAARIAEGRPIRLIAPLLPNKVGSPLKTKGTNPCLAEINLICRLAELAGIIDTIYKIYSDKAPEHAAEFIILGDGNRFSSALNLRQDEVSTYQSSLQWWIEKLDYKDRIRFRDYETTLQSELDGNTLAERTMFYEAALHEYHEVLDMIFDPSDMKETLIAAADRDPYPDLENPEGRFVPLFKSILYTYEDDKMHQVSETLGTDYARLYRTITAHAYQSFTPLNAAQREDIASKLSEGTKVPVDDLLKEYLRIEFIEKVWDATIKYLAAVKCDRDLEHDPVMEIFPDAVRYTIHSKKGQIGLFTTTPNKGDLVQAWHGVALLRSSRKETVKIENTSRLMAESREARPCILRASDDSDTPLTRLARQEQPLFYLDPSIPFSGEDQLVGILRNQMTRLVFR